VQVGGGGLAPQYLGSRRSFCAGPSAPPLLYADCGRRARGSARRVIRRRALCGVCPMTAALVALLLGLAAYEAKAWFPRILDALISVAVRRLPKRERDRFREEWRAHINDTPGAVLRIWQAVGFIVAS